MMYLQESSYQSFLQKFLSEVQGALFPPSLRTLSLMEGMMAPNSKDPHPQILPEMEKPPPFVLLDESHFLFFFFHSGNPPL